jgi:hypothetical protein
MQSPAFGFPDDPRLQVIMDRLAVRRRAIVDLQQAELPVRFIGNPRVQSILDGHEARVRAFVDSSYNDDDLCELVGEFALRRNPELVVRCTLVFAVAKINAMLAFEEWGNVFGFDLRGIVRNQGLGTQEAFQLVREDDFGAVEPVFPTFAKFIEGAAPELSRIMIHSYEHKQHMTYMQMAVADEQRSIAARLANKPK